MRTYSFQYMIFTIFFYSFNTPDVFRVRILARILAKCELKKAISEFVFSLLAFSREWKFGAVIRGS